MKETAGREVGRGVGKGGRCFLKFFTLRLCSGLWDLERTFKAPFHFLLAVCTQLDKYGQFDFGFGFWLGGCFGLFCRCMDE